MRLKRLFLLDMRFQAKYGFYFLYVALTVIYVVILLALPQSWREKAAAILIFSDPASMGLFFMGAIVLLEKSQHTPCAFAVSPVRAGEYMLAKIASLSAISLVVAALLALTAGITHLHMVLLGTMLSSVLFTLLGMMVATKIVSLNQFILWTVPVEVLAFVPAILHLWGVSPAVLKIYPANLCMDMISGAPVSLPGLFCTVILIGVLFIAVRKCVIKMWQEAGGIKL